MADSKDSKPGQKPRRRRGLLLRLFLWGVVVPLTVIWVIGALLCVLTPKLAGMNAAGLPISVPPDDIRLLVDLTGTDAQGKRVMHQQVADALLEMVRDAGDTLILDQFLVNRFRGGDLAPFARDTTAELVAALVRKQQESPDTWILFITDPVNSAYEDSCPKDLEPLRAAGVHLLVTDLEQLPDINLIHAPFYRVLSPVLEGLPFFSHQHVGNVFDPAAPPMSWKAFYRLANLKANHRKVAVMKDRQGDWHLLVSSANPHSGSAAHGNQALRLRWGPVRDALQGELALARNILLHRPEGCFSQTAAPELLRAVEQRLASLPNVIPGAPPPTPGVPRVTYLTERATAEKAEAMLAAATKGDRVTMLMFYFSDPGIIKALQGAAVRGAIVRLVLDANKDAFGREKNGVPNRVVARQLHDWAAENPARNLQIRWFATHGEQGHYKCLRVLSPDGGRDQLLAGSANFTVRNLRGFNLEADLFVEQAGAVGQRFDTVFAEVWDNTGGLVYSVEYATYAEAGRVSYAWKRLLKAQADLTGLCSW